jgi:hypothetical protein
MLDFLKPWRNEKYDFMTFTEGKKEDTIDIFGHEYTDSGEPLKASAMGECYHIILFRSHKTEDRYTDLDSFEAILSDPLEYMSGLIPQGWYGVIAKKTTTSEPIITRLLAKCRESM